MTKIKPYRFPGHDGKVYTATAITIVAHDDFTKSVSFSVTLLNDTLQHVAGCTIVLDGTDYPKWTAYAPHYAQGSAELCAAHLNMTLE